MRTLLAAPLYLSCLALVACGEDSDNRPEGDNEEVVCRAPGAIGTRAEDLNVDITRNTCLSADTVYTLKPKTDGTYVKVKPGVTLTVQAGTTIKGAAGSALVVTRGARIVADGTAANPIVFTSAKAAGSRDGGDWGGILILGEAPTNWSGNNELFEALPATDDDGRYGGTDAADDSGVLRYVRIEFAGFEYDTDKEFNGLTLCGVGSSTLIDHVQVHRGSDDGVELFGGTVNVKHLVLSQNEDDGLDTDNGWVGKGQFIVVQHLNATSNDPNGYESDDHKSNFSALPRTSPTVYNATLVGDMAQTKPSFGAVIRRGAAGRYFNHIVMGFPSAAIEVRNAESAGGYPSVLSIQSSVFFGNGASAQNWSAAQADFDEAATFGSAGNLSFDPGLTAPMSLSAPSFLPGSVASVTEGAATPPNDGFFDVTATFIGAMGAVDWTSGWTAYPAG